MTDISPCLWFNGNLEEALDFYGAVFPDAKVGTVARLPDGSPYFAEFELAGRRFKAINAESDFRFSEAVSLFVDCADQAEVDRLWDALLSGGGQESRCGWLTDRFGLSWQIVPVRLGELLRDADAEQAARVNEAILSMVKLDVAALEAAYAGSSGATRR